MSWSIVTIRDLEDVEDGRLYPIPGLKPDEIELEDSDGDNIARVTGTALRVWRKPRGSDKWAEILKAPNIKASVLITDCRVAVACSKYDKGGGWIGGSPLVLPFNALSKASAAVRRHGKMLVGQVRYPWLSLVAAMEKTGWLSNEQIKLFSADRATRDEVMIAITLPTATSSVKLAAEIARRTARFRLASEPGAKAESLVTWHKLTNPAPLCPPKGKAAVYDLGQYWLAQPSFAYGPPREGA